MEMEFFSIYYVLLRITLTEGCNPDGMGLQERKEQTIDLRVIKRLNL